MKSNDEGRSEYVEQVLRKTLEGIESARRRADCDDVPTPDWLQDLIDAVAWLDYLGPLPSQKED